MSGIGDELVVETALGSTLAADAATASEVDSATASTVAGAVGAGADAAPAVGTGTPATAPAADTDTGAVPATADAGSGTDTVPLLDIGPLLLMVSGGSDSTALCRLVADLCDAGGHSRETVLVLHINHLLRGGESDSDAKFVEALAEECGFAFDLRVVDVASLVRRGGGNLENVARVERYRLAEKSLKAFCRKHDLDPAEGRICTAHTLDDRIETFVMRSIVGVGPGGLGSIPRMNGRVVRPLLDLTRNHLRAYLLEKAGYDTTSFDAGEALGLWCEDSTNADTDHFRSYVRHEIIPRMRMCNPGLDDNIRRTMDLVVDESDFLDEQIAIVLSGGIVIDDDDGTVEVDCERLFSLALPLRRRAIHALCASALPSDERVEAQHIERIVSEGDQPRFALSLPGNILVRNEYGKLLFLQPGAVGGAGEASITEFDFDLAFFGTVVLPGGGTLSAYLVDAGADPEAYARQHATANRIYVDGDRIAAMTADSKVAVTTIDPAGRGDNPFFSLHVTNVRGTDVFCPLGMGGAHKKVAGLLSDEKLPHRKRANTAVVRAEEAIVWVCGVRLDDRFKVTSATEHVLCLELNEADEH